MDVALITASIAGIKFIKDSFSAVLEVKTEIEVQDKVHAALNQLGDIQENLFSLRDQLFDLQSKNQELQNELKIESDWKTRLSEYELTRTIGGAIVYGCKSTIKHYACPRCINNKEIQILQDTRTMGGDYECPNCKTRFPVDQEKFQQSTNREQEW